MPPLCSAMLHHPLLIVKSFQIQTKDKKISLNEVSINTMKFFLLDPLHSGCDLFCVGDKFKEEIDVLTLSTPIISCAAQATLALLYIML